MLEIEAKLAGMREKGGTLLPNGSKVEELVKRPDEIMGRLSTAHSLAGIAFPESGEHVVCGLVVGRGQLVYVAEVVSRARPYGVHVGARLKGP